MVFSGCEQPTDDGPSAPALTGTVTITGTPLVGATLTADTSELNAPPPSEKEDDLYQYEWETGTLDQDGEFTPDSAEDDGEDDNSTEYIILSEDDGKYIRVVVSVDGYSGSVPSEPVGPVTVTPPTYTVTVPQLTNGSVSADTASATAEATITLTVSPAPRYQLTGGSLTVTKAGGVTVPVTQVTGSGNKYTFTMPAANVTVQAQFELLPAGVYSISAGTMTGGTVGISSASATENATVTLTVTPYAGYQYTAYSLVIAKAGGGTVPATMSGNTYTFTMPADDITVTAQFTLISYSVSIAGGIANGSVSASPVSATVGQTVTPVTAYQLKEGSLKVNGSAVGIVKENNSTYTFSMGTPSLRRRAQRGALRSLRSFRLAGLRPWHTYRSAPFRIPNLRLI
jgi:hypothetical protein